MRFMGALLERATFSDALDERLANVVAGRGQLVLVVGRGRHRQERAGARVLRGAPRAGARAVGRVRRARNAAAAGPADRHRRDAVEGPLLACVREGEKPHAVFLALLDELRAVGADDRRDRGRALGRRGDARRRPAARAAGRGARCARHRHLPRERARADASAAPGRRRARHRAGRDPAAAAAALARGRRSARRAARRRCRRALRQDRRQPVLRHGGAGRRGHGGATDRSRRGARPREPAGSRGAGCARGSRGRAAACRSVAARRAGA